MLLESKKVIASVIFDDEIFVISHKANQSKSNVISGLVEWVDHLNIPLSFIKMRIAGECQI